MLEEFKMSDMKKSRRLFSTPKKAVVSIICIIIIVLLAAAVISAVVIKSTLISKDEATKIALNDSALTESDVSGLRTELEFDDGRFCYEVDFYCDGIEYEYTIQAKDGGIISRDIDGENIKNSAQNTSVSQSESAESGAESQNTSAENNAESTEAAVKTENSLPVSVPDANAAVSEEDAKKTALDDAGLSESEVTFTKTKLDTDDGIKVYDVEFYNSDAEYDYEINAADGTVKKKSVETFSIQSGTSSSTEYIGVDKAKEIALANAGLKETEVKFSKAKLENDDRAVKYEISFYIKNMEYEYSIDALSGDILEFDFELK